MTESSTSLTVPAGGSRYLLGSAMRLAVRTVTALPGATDVALRLAARHAGLRTEDLPVRVGEATTPGSLFLPAGVTRPPCVLLLHGTSAWSPLAYLFFIDALLDRGLGVMCVDLDGHGRHPHVLTGAGLGRTAVAALEQLAGHDAIDPRRLGVMGISLGGSCALRAAAETGAVRGLALVATPVRVSMPSKSRLWEFVSTLNPEALAGWRRVPTHGLLRTLESRIRVPPDSTPTGDAEIDLFHRFTEPIIQRAIDELAPLDAAGRVSDVPVFFLNGAWDSIAPAGQAHELASYFSGPSERLVVPRRNHFTLMTSGRGATVMADHLERWLRR